MNKHKPLVIHIYRDMLRQAEIFRQKAEKLKGEDIPNEEAYERYEYYTSLAQEIYHWCAEFEKTEEVNPTH